MSEDLKPSCISQLSLQFQARTQAVAPKGRGTGMDRFRFSLHLERWWDGKTRKSLVKDNQRCGQELMVRLELGSMM